MFLTSSKLIQSLQCEAWSIKYFPVNLVNISFRTWVKVNCFLLKINDLFTSVYVNGVYWIHIADSLTCKTIMNRPGRKRGFLGYRGYHGFFFSNFCKSLFSIFTNSEYRKLGFQKIRDFQTSVFYGEYRKHGCLKTSVFWNLSFRYSLDRCLKSEIFKHPCFRYSL